MAYSATALLAVRAMIADAIAGKINQNELRQPMTGALSAYFASTPNLIAGGAATIANIKNSSAQPVNIPILKQLSADVDSTRACTGTEEGDSALVTPTWQTVSKDFKMSELLFADNEIGYQVALQHNFMECFRKLHINLDSKATTNLESNKSFINAGTINTMNDPTDTMQVSLANKDQYFASIMTEMAQNDFVGMKFNVHSLAQILEINRQQAQGQANSNNLQYQFTDFAHYGSSNVSVPSGATSASYIFVPGTVGIVPWINKLHRVGGDIGTDVWTTIADPFVPGLTWELKIRKSCVDNSSTITGGQADLVTEFRISAEFAYITAYSSNTDSGIYKYAQMSS